MATMKNPIDVVYEGLKDVKGLKIERSVKFKGHHDTIFEGSPYNCIIFKSSDNKYFGDAICFLGSYGFEDGLLEIMGKNLFKDYELDSDDVVGYLTPCDVINRVRTFVSKSL